MAWVEARSIREPVRWMGRTAEQAARQLGAFALLTGQVLKAFATGKVSMREVLNQAYEMGVESVPLVALTSILSGVVTSQQGAYQFTGPIPLYVLGSVVASSIILELGPLMTAFVVIGRVGARITAEIGTMQVSEQIDALYSLGRDPVRMLAAPRLVAGLLVMPVLVAIANFSGVLAGMVAAQTGMGLGYEVFLYGVRLYWKSWDLGYSLGKGLAFGFIIPLLAAHMGFLTHGGAEGVGKATTRSVVLMIVAVLTLDSLFPPLFLN